MFTNKNKNMFIINIILLLNIWKRPIKREVGQICGIRSEQ